MLKRYLPAVAVIGMQGDVEGRNYPSNIMEPDVHVGAVRVEVGDEKKTYSVH